ncbi:MAG: non-homologous end-joining DNA ligase [Gemmatimonadota bacterium]
MAAVAATGRGVPRFVPPQLARLAPAAPTGSEWLLEVKYDGYRIEAIVTGGGTKLLSRNGLDWTGRFDGVAAELSRLPCRSAVVDGEACALDSKGRSRFQYLQPSFDHSDRHPLVYFAFDLLHLNGEDLRGLPVDQRRGRLAKLLGARRGKSASVVRLSEELGGSPAAALARACRQGLEGILAKRRDAPYRSGRSDSWLKVKCSRRQELIIVGYTPPRGGRVGLGALLLAVADDNGDLRYAGRVGTGMDHEMLTRLERWLSRMKVTQPPVINPPARKRGPAYGVGPRWSRKCRSRIGPATACSGTHRSRGFERTSWSRIRREEP